MRQAVKTGPVSTGNIPLYCNIVEGVMTLTPLLRLIALNFFSCPS